MKTLITGLEMYLGHSNTYIKAPSSRCCHYDSQPTTASAMCLSASDLFSILISFLTNKNNSFFFKNGGPVCSQVLKRYTKGLLLKITFSRIQLSASKYLTDLKPQETNLTSPHITRRTSKYCEVTATGELDEEHCYLQVMYE